MIADPKLLEENDRLENGGGAPILLVALDAGLGAEWEKCLHGVGDAVFCVQSLAEGLAVLGETEGLGVPIGLAVVVGREWSSAVKSAAEGLRRWKGEGDLSIFVACASWARAELFASVEAGVNLTFAAPWDFEWIAVQAKRGLQVARRGLEAKRERDRAAGELTRHRQNSMSQDVWRLDLGSRTLEFSELCGKLNGFASRDSGTNLDEWLNLIHPADLVRLNEALSRTDWKIAPEDLSFEFQLRHQDWGWRWLLMRGRLERDQAGRPVQVSGSHTDITLAKTTDPVTGLPNRFQFEDWLHARPGGKAGSFVQVRPTVFLVGIDRGELLRDSLGQALGDQLLRVAGERLLAYQDQAGDGIVARLSGDEFGVALTAIFEPEAARARAEEMDECLSKGIWLDGRQLFLSTSIGYAFSEDGQIGEALLRDAEIAAHSEKVTGGNRIVAFDRSMRAKVIERMELENDMKRATDEWEFEVFYQPKVALSGERIIGFEALLRWRHPERGIITPSIFIPLAEVNGMIIPIGIQTVKEACRTILAWQLEFPQDPQLEVSVNLSVRQFQDRHLIEDVRAILEETGIPPATLQFEVTESVLVDDPTQALEIVEALRRMGIGLKIDDFGTGYSSLSYLHRLPFDTLKIDRSFISTMTHDHTAHEIVRAIISLAQSLGLKVVAEGIETRSQAEVLRALGCGFGQGYLFAPPLRREAAHRMLAKQAEGLTGASPDMPPLSPQTLEHCA